MASESKTEPIDLLDVPKSEEVLLHISLADKLTKETGLEHGFKFCKPKDKIIVDKLCVGTACKIDISPEKCDEHAHTFHTHPLLRDSGFSVGDIYNNAYRSFMSGAPNIGCVKGEFADEVFCDETDMKGNRDKMKAISDSFREYKTPLTPFERQEKYRMAIYLITVGMDRRQMLFDDKTGEVKEDYYQ